MCRKSAEQKLFVASAKVLKRCALEEAAMLNPVPLNRKGRALQLQENVYAYTVYGFRVLSFCKLALTYVDVGFIFKKMFFLLVAV